MVSVQQGVSGPYRCLFGAPQADCHHRTAYQDAQRKRSSPSNGSGMLISSTAFSSWMSPRTENGGRSQLTQTLRATLQGLTRQVNSPYVFADGKGKLFQDVEKTFHSACRMAGVKDFRSHDLRHTFASHLVMASVDLPRLKELLGHKNLTMTLRYAHLAPSHKVKALSRLELGMGKKSTVQKLYNPMKKGLAQLS